MGINQIEIVIQILIFKPFMSWVPCTSVTAALMQKDMYKFWSNVDENLNNLCVKIINKYNHHGSLTNH